MNNKALLVGINVYPEPRNELRGCINDILDMEHFISDSHKVYAPENIKKLTDRDATKKGILTQIQWLLEGAQPGDQLLFQYSGHGAQIPTHDAALEKDGLDEIICPYDFDGSSATAFRDKEFAQLFAAVPHGVHFVWVSDSCHSEDLSWDPIIGLGNKYRFFNRMADEVTEGRIVDEENSNISFVDGSLLGETGEGILGRSRIGETYPNILGSTANTITTPLNGALLSACASDELSADAYINNRFNGAFTYYLIQNLMRYSNHKNMQSIIQLVNSDLMKNGYDQSPKSEGLLENKNFFL
jgi:hypothetical protein